MNHPLNERVKKFQKSTGKNIAEFTEALDIKSSSVFYNAFRGRNKIGTDVLEAIAEVYKPDMNQFFYDKEAYAIENKLSVVAENQEKYNSREEILQKEIEHLKEVNTLLKESYEQCKTTLKDLRNSRKD